MHALWWVNSPIHTVVGEQTNKYSLVNRPMHALWWVNSPIHTVVGEQTNKYSLVKTNACTLVGEQSHTHCCG